MKLISLFTVLIMLTACGLDAPPEKQVSQANENKAPAGEEQSAVALEAAPAGVVTVEELKPVQPLSVQQKLKAMMYASDVSTQTDLANEIQHPTAQQSKLIRCAESAKLEGSRDFLLDLARSPEQTDLFHTLAKTNSVDIVRSLIACGYTDGVASADSQGRIPLHYAKSREMIQLLWNYGTGRNKSVPGYATEDNKMMLPLHVYASEHVIDGVAYYRGEFCASRGSLFGSIVDGLRGNILNKPDAFGRTALHFAAIADDADVAEVLSACPSVTLDLKDKRNRTPLREAAEHSKFVTGFVILENAQKRHVHF